MIAIAVILLAVADEGITLSTVRLEAAGEGLVVRLALSGPVPALVERDGRDLLLILPGAHAAPGLVLPEPVAEIQALTVDDAREGVRLRIRLETVRPYELTREQGLVSLAIPPLRPAPPARGPESVRDLYAKILPPPLGTGSDEPVSAADQPAPVPEVAREGLRFGPLRLVPSLVTSYIDADSALLDTAAPVRDRYFQIEPRLLLDMGDPAAGARRLQVNYTPRYRVDTAYSEVRRPTHVVTAALDAPIGSTVTLRARHHYAHGVLETTEVDPGREFFFPLAPFTRHETQVGTTLNAEGLISLDLDFSRDSVAIDEEGGFFDHLTYAASSTVNYQFGGTSRAYLRYTWSHVPTPVERPLAESTASTVSIGVSGEVLPLVTGNLTAGLQRLDAPGAGTGGTRFRGTTLSAALKKEFTPTFSLGLLARRDTFPSDFETNAFYVATGIGVETDLGLPLSLVFHGAVGWQRNSYQVVATGLSVPRQDDILGWSAGIGRSLTRWSFLRADYREDRRNSNVPAYETDGHAFVIQLGLGYLGISPSGAPPR